MSTKQLLEVETNGKWEQGLKTSISIRDFQPFIVDEPKNLGGTDEGPNPVELVLGALSSCTSVMIAFIAKEQKFSYRQVEFKNTGTLDLQGLMGVEGVSPHFQTVSFEVIIKTDETDERTAKLKEAVEKRCPVMNLLLDAGVKVESNWIKR
ncbi:osmotically inducible protein C [Anaerobacillus alkalilacustris]|uniref:Osmotically inducible protein C n=1 Tax=Anaerobacillus alkalilacustris TaxID=393763 RepID=A0A1S2LUZ8_9BACI|nr:OsmC family protein [Anaerobacillus alkalilacustris]OIJ16348.1 osmotically inducible protein C [Anaerobacillus alkalilacustris]